MDKQNIRLKICGMREPGNIAELAALQPDYMGFIFYPGSGRYVGEGFVMPDIGSVTRKVGVFVNENLDAILRKVDLYSLDAVQLHGSESPAFVRELSGRGVELIKAFGVAGGFDFAVLEEYAGLADFFLFDTKTHLHGGSGKRFDWALLDDYALEVPFFLSGGIGPAHAETVRQFRHPQWFALDVNSGFETQPGYKDTGALRNFKEEIIR